MINLRYHIVSITAVFLALGIGVALGSTLIERATVDTLNRRLDEQSQRLDRTDGENAELRDELDRLADLEEELTQQGPALYGGHLADVPVVVLTVQGTDDDLLALTRRSLRLADAQVVGVLSLTSRWESLSQAEVAELSLLLDQDLVRGPETRRAALQALASELLVASEPAPEPETQESDTTSSGTDSGDTGTTPTDAGDEQGSGAETATDGTGSEGDGTTGAPTAEDSTQETTTTTLAVEPNGTLLDALIDLGYVEFLAEDATEPLPDAGARYVLVLGETSEVDVTEVVLPFVDAMAEVDPSPMVVTETSPPLPDIGEEADIPDPRPAGPTITAIRADESLAVRVSTADGAAGFIGQSAVVLAVADLVSDPPRVGQYGVAVGATSLLPPVEE